MRRAAFLIGSDASIFAASDIAAFHAACQFRHAISVAMSMSSATGMPYHLPNATTQSMVANRAYPLQPPSSGYGPGCCRSMAATSPQASSCAPNCRLASASRSGDAIMQSKQIIDPRGP